MKKAKFYYKVIKKKNRIDIKIEIFLINIRSRTLDIDENFMKISQYSLYNSLGFCAQFQQNV